jgi:cytochrome c
MSKSPNFLLPALGGTGIILGTAIGVASYNYGTDRIALLESRVAQVEANASEAAAKAGEAQALAEAEAQRAMDLEAQLASMPAGGTVSAPAPQRDGRYGLGRTAHPEEIAAWDVDVLPDGRGLPEGSGDVWTGDEIFADACASCHGDFAEGVDNWPVLAGGFDTLANKDPVKTVGSYWPYLSTVWDYVNRSMPFGAAQTLEPDEVYAVVAYILYSNDLVDDDFVLSHENFADFEMYNKDGFVVDDRPELEYAEWRSEPCMENCKESVKITMRATFLDVTPDDGGASVMNSASADETPTFTAATASAGAAVETAAADGALLEQGEKVFSKCKSCHQIGEGAKNRSGPQLTGIMGRQIGGLDDFKYSDVFLAAAEEGRVWDDEEMAAFLAQPKEHMKGTRMSFPGLKDEGDLTAIIAYLKSFDG